MAALVGWVSSVARAATSGNTSAAARRERVA